MNVSDEQMKRDVLRRVKRAHFYRVYMRPFALECSALAALVGVTAFFVSLKNVVANATETKSFVDFEMFILNAFLDSELEVKALSVAMLIVLILIVKDSARGITSVARRNKSLSY